jgi:putative transposase
MNKAYRVRLYPTQEQEVLINKTFGCVRLVWNTLLDKNIKGFENEGKSWKQDYNTTELKDSFEFLTEVSAASLQQKARDLKATYSQWFRSVFLI